jgi:hypothetical protein
LAVVGDIYVVDFGDDEARGRRAAERDAEFARLKERYAQHLVAEAAIDEATSRRAVAALFDPRDANGARCPCSCHPQLSAEHGDGFDCRCTWDEGRRAAEAAKLKAFWDSDPFPELSAAHRREEEEIAAWLTGQPDVEATRTTSMAPEQWEGTVDGHSFYFRERHGFWRIELDLTESGRFARRLVQVDDGGAIVTEPSPIMEGDVIAEGIDSQLGETPVDHIAFIVRTIRDYLWGAQCDHAGALFYCPKCGQRMSEAM